MNDIEIRIDQIETTQDHGYEVDLQGENLEGRKVRVIKENGSSFTMRVGTNVQEGRWTLINTF